MTDRAIDSTPVVALAAWVSELSAESARLDDAAECLTALATLDDLDAAQLITTSLARAAYERRSARHDRDVADLDAAIAHDQLRAAFRALSERTVHNG